MLKLEIPCQGQRHSLMRKKTESEKLRKFWHQEVDTIFDKIDSMGRSYSEGNLIKKLISEMMETVKQNEELLKTNNIYAVNKSKSKLQEYEDFPENLDSQMPTLCSKIDNRKELNIEIADFTS